MSKELTENYSMTYRPDLADGIYYVFKFNDGKEAKFKMSEDIKNLQDFLDRMNKVHELEQQKQKVIALIKDGRFVEALQELEK